MNSQTARRPDSQRSTRTAKAKKYIRQTAHVEARRDGKPLIFGWGGHLSRSEKMRLQRRAIWFTTSIVAILIVAVLVFFWLNINVITPNLPITTVNGQGIPQSDFRKMVAVKAQIQVDAINGPKGLNAQSTNLKTQIDAQQKIVDDTTKKITSLNTQIKALHSGQSAQRTALNSELATTKTQFSAAQTKHDALALQYQDLTQNQLAQAKQLYTQPQVGNDSVDWLQQDALIRQWLTKQNSGIQTKIEPSSGAIDAAVRDFTTNLPKSTSYNKFLNDDRLSDSDVRAMLAVKLRIDNMQTYQASLVQSPTYQVQARAMTISTPRDATNVLQQLKKGADFAKLAKQKSVDTNTNTKGGDLGWMARGQYTVNASQKASGVIDNWLFDPARKINELSPVLSENGTSHIVQIMAIDPSRSVDAQTLQSLKDNALTIWVLSQKALPGSKVTDANQDMLSNTDNMPPGLPASAPSSGSASPSGGLPPGSTGLPAGASSTGLPAGTSGGVTQP
jgi:parvulin-like peptidyl-prolyl isomerase